jgi:hypothetical protein
VTASFLATVPSPICKCEVGYLPHDRLKRIKENSWLSRKSAGTFPFRQAKVICPSAMRSASGIHSILRDTSDSTRTRENRPATPSRKHVTSWILSVYTLTRSGFSMQEVVSLTIFCPDLLLFDTFNRVYRTYFRPPFPARAFIGSGPLLFGARFEIQGIAVKGGD